MGVRFQLEQVSAFSGIRNVLGYVVEPFDEGQMAIDHRYAAADPDECLDRWQSERSKTVELLKSMSSADWFKTGSHPERGPMTVLDHAVHLLGHDVYHIEQLSALI